MKSNNNFYDIYKKVVIHFKSLFEQLYGENSEQYKSILNRIDNIRSNKSFKLQPGNTDNHLGRGEHYFRVNSPALLYFRAMVPKTAYRVPDEEYEGQNIVSRFAVILLRIARECNCVDFTREPPKDEDLETWNGFGAFQSGLKSKIKPKSKAVKPISTMKSRSKSNLRATTQQIKRKRSFNSSFNYLKISEFNDLERQKKRAKRG